MGQLLEVLGSRERRELVRASGGPLGDVTEERDRSGPHSLTAPVTPVGASRRVREVRHRPRPPNLRLSGRWLSTATGEQQTVCRWCFFLGDLANLRTRLGPGAAEQAFDADLEILWRTTRDNVTLGREDRAYGDRGSSSQFSPH